MLLSEPDPAKAQAASKHNFFLPNYPSLPSPPFPLFAPPLNSGSKRTSGGDPEKLGAVSGNEAHGLPKVGRIHVHGMTSHHSSTTRGETLTLLC